ncbi:BTAD domain-containing putative transcriptional regulator [Streptomyces sp. NPDC090994]|uniref:AfsR/SARP family transcriptional regulator n=1 Tax=Streptomyces sp. NPDC090994 TaxID=3365969 RepID=UPI0037F77CCF
MHRIVVRLLGALDVTYGAERLTVPAGRPRALLAALALRHGAVVPVEEIMERLWGDDPPAAARTTIRGHVKRLRRVLDGSHDDARSVIEGERGGYRLSVERVSVDSTEFRDRARGATALGAAAGPDAEAAALDGALALWRGPALAGIDAPSLHQDIVPSLEELRLRAVHRRIAIGLDREDPADHIPQLRETLAADPLQERFWAQLILALHRSGRPAEALREYERCRRLLGERLGVDPGLELRELHQRMLAGDAAPVAAARPAAPSGGPGRYVPRQLPAGDAPFVGRADELATLDRELLDGNGLPADGTRRVLLLDGPAGVGKTALAVHWANSRQERFPDGQVYLDLDGFSGRPPMSVADALHALLVGLGTARDEVPADPHERSALLRSTLAGRRVLLVLDNALCPEQVRPLLPGRTGTTLVTSRNQLRGLVVRNGARRLTLPPLDPEQAAVLLRALLPGHRTGPDSLRELVALCGGLPLALRILAERVAQRPGVPLARLVDEIRGECDPLSVFRLGEDITDLGVVMSWSLRGLTDAAAALHKALARGAGLPVCPADAAAVLGVPERTADLLLDELAQLHLVERYGSDRYRVPSVFPACPDERRQAMTADRAQPRARASAGAVPGRG